MTDHKPLPVHGYTAQNQAIIDVVNLGKELEERVLRYLEVIGTFSVTDQRALALGKTHIQTGFMWAFRSAFNPQRAKLPEDPQ
jgi:hypothetical protein